jgi:hypothetical protein
LAFVIWFVPHAAHRRERGLALDKAEGFESSTGIGVQDAVGGKKVALGNTALMTQLGVPVDALKVQAEALRAEGASVMFLAVDGRSAGLLAVSDPIKASTAEALATLKASGMRVVMATGDGLTTAKAVAAKLGIPARRSAWGGQARRQTGAGEQAAARGSHRRDGRRRHQRCASTCEGRRRCGDGHRHRCGDEQRPGDAGQGRLAGHGAWRGHGRFRRRPSPT